MSTEAQQDDLGRVTVEQANEVIAKALEVERVEDYSEYSEENGSQRPKPTILKVQCPEGPGVWISFHDEKRALAEAIFYPLYPAQIFLEHARIMITWRAESYKLTDEQREKVIFDNAVLMMRYMLHFIQRRVDLSLGNMVHEITEVRNIELRAWDEEQYRAAGIPLRYKNQDEFRTNLFNDYVAEIKRLWNMPSPGGSKADVVATNEQLMTFAGEYPKLLKHWQEVIKWRKSHLDRNWRGHAKVDNADTPDDLLDKLDDLDPYTRQASKLAHEHAARRANILRAENCDEETLKARESGIPATGCSESQLSRLRRRGEKLLECNQSPQMSDSKQVDSPSLNPPND
ncbi:MAG TPA: hypothetical protein VGX48_16245 [Pyrinomonadaceae bacterium]|nr:hypothetical protein [Pyrinomonadaceae bacterium]